MDILRSFSEIKKGNTLPGKTNITKTKSQNK